MSVPYSNDPARTNMDDKLDTKHQQGLHVEYADDEDNKVSAQPVDSTLEPVPVSAFVNLTPSQTIRKFWRLYSAGIATAVGAVYIGYGLSIPGNIIANSGFIEVFATEKDPRTGSPILSATHVSLWGGTQFAVQILFQVLSPLTSDRFGVKVNLYIPTIAIVIAIVLEILAKDWKVFLAAKIFAGIANAYLGPGLVCYVSEISLPKIRGAMTMPFAFMFALGSLFGAITLRVIRDHPSQFRAAFYSQFVLLGMWLVPLVVLPETPVFYCKQGKHEKAKKSLRRLIGNVEGFDVDHEYSVIRYEVELSQEALKQTTQYSWVSVFQPKNLKRVCIGALPLMLQGLAGAALTFGYSTYFFLQAGIADPFTATLITNIILLAGIVSSVFLIERVGRRPLVLTCTVGCLISVMVIGGLANVPITNKAGPNGIIAMTCIWMAFYSVGIPPVGWTYLGEISTVALRSKAIGLGVTLQSFINLILQYTVPVMLDPAGANWGARIGYLFGGLTAVWLVLMFFFMPETKGRTPAEIDELFERGISPRKFGSTETKVDIAAAELVQKQA